MKTKTITLRLDEEDYRAIEKVAKELDVSKAWVIRKLIKNGLEDLYLGELSKRVMLERGEWIDHERVKEELLENKMAQKS